MIFSSLFHSRMNHLYGAPPHPASLTRTRVQIGAMAAVDSVGLFLRWSFLDHAAHLGAVAVAYVLTAQGGYQAVIDYQRKLVDQVYGGGGRR